ncbi:MAG TPA: Gfo/Idh/MocA family oxidoreductase [Gaiellaceae bacterium]|nr:Gfo/Idh/MocA family oxidoreductase [Gaiellaceae bacterium]
MRLGIVGCGGISQRHGPSASASSEVDIVACCDTRIEVAREWAATYGCEHVYADYRKMVDELELDGVLIATWPVQHCEHILGCLDAGAGFVLCEKSLTTSAAEAIEVFRAARAKSATVVEALMYRHHPAVTRVEQLLEDGAVGAIDSVRAYFNLVDPEDSGPDDPDRDWRQHVELGGGVPYDLACYCVDACNHFAGRRPRRALAVSASSERYGTVNRLYGLIEYADSPVGIVASSTRSDFDHELKISGAGGHVVLPVAWRIEGRVTVTLSRSVGWGTFREERYETEPADPFRLQLERFAAVIRGEAAPAPTLAESVVAAATLDALLRSAEDGTSVEIGVPEDVV